MSSHGSGNGTDSCRTLVDQRIATKERFLEEAHKGARRPTRQVHNYFKQRGRCLKSVTCGVRRKKI